MDVAALNVSHAGLNGARFTSTTNGLTRGPTVAGGGSVDLEVAQWYERPQLRHIERVLGGR